MTRFATVSEIEKGLPTLVPGLTAVRVHEIHYEPTHHVKLSFSGSTSVKDLFDALAKFGPRDTQWTLCRPTE